MQNQLDKFRDIYNEYPRAFWTLIVITFIDRVGGAMLFPFFALYLTRKFDIGMTQVGVLFAAFSFSSIIGTMLGGALTDRLGRKGIIIFGLVSTSLSTLGMVNTYTVCCCSKICITKDRTGGSHVSCTNALPCLSK